MTKTPERGREGRGSALLVAAGLGGVLLVGAAVVWLPEGPSGSAFPGIAVPAGFEIELAAGPPLTERPIVVDMDEEGRLYVAESSGSNDHVKKQLKERPHSILRLEDADGDGRYDRRTVFADKMMFPEGVLWYDGSLYVAAPPHIWKLTDTDDDGVADRREEWFDGKTLTNCANDLHGPYLGPDGWIYWAKGAFAEQTYERPGRKPLVTKASHIFRRRPEGGLIESVMAGGMDNPVEVAFTPEGERFITSTFIEQPALGRRDGLLHAVYGGVYGKVHGVTDSHPQTGGLLPALVQLGPAVPVGLDYYSTDALGAGYQGNLFATLFNLNKVIRVELKPKGATFEPQVSDFVTSTRLDFHPTDVMEDADGSLLVVDTGAWYVLCCPSSVLSQPEVHGAIYRVKRRGAAAVEDARGLSFDWRGATAAELAGLLDDWRPVVRERAIQELSKRGGDALGVLREILSQEGREKRSVAARRNAVWALTRIPGAEAREAVRAALADSEESVRHAATHSASVWRDAEARSAIEKQLGDAGELGEAGAQLQRAAAEALGRIGDGGTVAILLDAVERTEGQTEDEVLTHSLTYALIEIADPAATRRGLGSSSSRVRRAVMLALDQMEGPQGQMDTGGVGPETVIPLLSSADPLLRETAGWIVGRHVEWGGSLAGYFRGRLAAAKHDATNDDAARHDEAKHDGRADLQRELARYAGDAAIQKLLADTVRGDGPKPARITALGAMSKAALKEAPASWVAALASVMSNADGDLLRSAVSTARALPTGEERNAQLDKALLRVGRNAGVAADVRAGALAASAVALPSVSAELFEFLVAQVDSAKPVPVRSAASRALAAAPLDGEQRLALTDSVRTAGPLELPTLLGAFEKGGDEALGEALTKALEDARSLANLRTDTLEGVLAEFPASVQAKGEALLASLDVDRAQQRAHLEELASSLGGGDPRRGKEVFKSSKAACSSCHRMGYLGGRIGPDLTRVGKIRSERDLLESLVYPSASFVRNYEPVVVVTARETYSGVPLEETDESILLATGADEQVRVARDAIEELRPGTVSIMPSGLEEELTRQELADLIAFMKKERRSASARPTD